MPEAIKRTVELMSQLPKEIQNAELIRLQASVDTLDHIAKVQREREKKEAQSAKNSALSAECSFIPGTRHL